MLRNIVDAALEDWTCPWCRLVTAAGFAGLLAAVVVAGCGKGTELTPTGPATLCSSGKATGSFPGVSAQPVGVNGGTFSVSVVAPGNCSWTVTSNVPWAAVVGESVRQGSQTVSYNVQANTSGSRAGAINYSFGLSHTTLIVQNGRYGCVTDVQPKAAALAAGSSAIDVQVKAAANCVWAFEGNGDWVTVTPADDPTAWGRGDGTVRVVAAANLADEPRTTTVVIGNRQFDVTQDGVAIPGCEYWMLPPAGDIEVSQLGGNVDLRLRTRPGCEWLIDEVDDPHSIISVWPRGPFVGNQTISLHVPPNPTLAARIATIAFANPPRTVRLVNTIRQASATCTYNVSPATRSFTSAGGRGSFVVDADPESCRWTTWSSAEWLVVDSGHQGTGMRTVYYEVAPKTPLDSGTIGRIVVSGLSGLNPSAVHHVYRDYSPYD